MNWRPLVDRSSSLGVKALTVLDEVTETILLNENPGCDAPLMLAYLAMSEHSRPRMDQAIERLNRSIRRAEALYSTRRFGLHDGLAGLGWTIEHVARRLNGLPPGQTSSELNEDTDSALFLELERGKWRGDWSLRTGLTGIGVYFLERLPEARAVQGLRLVLAHHEERWRTACPEFQPTAAELRDLAYLLCELVTAGIEQNRSLKFLENVLNRLVAGVRYDSIDWFSSRLGIAAAVSAIGRRMERADCREFWRRELEECSGELRVMHGGNPLSLRGILGAGHVWNRLWQVDGDSGYREEAMYCFEKGLDSVGSGVKGVEPGFMGGTAGAGLALTAALTSTEPEWDRLVCLSTR
jgi:hypothetical protein